MLRRFRVPRWGTWLLLALVPGAALASVFGAKTAGPVQTIPLEKLGFQLPVPRMLLTGDSLFTVHYVDNQHLLVTFTSHGLIKRRADAQANDQDRSVAALLLELPSGKVLARTDWQLQDHRPYLWPLGQGHFLLRIKNKLTLVSPMAHLAEGKAFEEQAFLDISRQIAHISVTPMGDLLTIETEPMPVGVKETLLARAGTVTAIEDPSRPPVQINFYRMLTDTAKVTPVSAGVVRAQSLVEIPVDSDGYLDVSQESSGVYLFDFQAHGGKRLQLSPYDTSCVPRARFVSASEFVAFGCSGSAERQQLSGFNLKGEQNWISAYTNRHVFPSILAAPAAGRFAVSRTVVTGTYLDVDNLTPEQVAGQEITVIQSYDGRQLLKLTAMPAELAGGNVDLSPDGLGLALFHGDAIELYRLPALTKQDQSELAAARAQVPEHTAATIDLGARAKKGKVPDAVKSAATADREGMRVGAETVPAEERVDEKPATGQASADAAGSSASANASGDVVGDGPRKPPTLYDKDHPKTPQ